MFEHVNWLAVLGATVVSFAIGAVWYSALFSKPWRRLVGIPEGSMASASTGQMATPLLVNFVITFVSATAVAVIVTAFPAEAVTAAFVGGLIWVAAGMVVKLNDTIFAQRPVGLFYIDGGLQLVQLVVTAIIVSVYRA
jgi:hypothetical protein